MAEPHRIAWHGHSGRFRRKRRDRIAHGARLLHPEATACYAPLRIDSMNSCTDGSTFKSDGRGLPVR